MAEKKSIVVSGAAFSFLLYEVARNKTNQEGFLLGEFRENEVRSITDNDQLLVTIQKTLKIHAVLPCPHSNYFYNGNGIINKEKLNSFLDKRTSEVIGWYRLRYMTNNKLTLRDKIIHKQLMRFFTPPAELFTCGLLLVDHSNLSTHVFKQVFLQYSNLSFKPVNINILNLSNPTFSYKVPEKSTKLFNRILNSLKNDGNSLQTAEDIQLAVQLHINKVIKELTQQEINMFNLEQEVRSLQDQLKMKRSMVQMQFEDNFVVNGELPIESISNSSSASNSNCILDNEQSNDVKDTNKHIKESDNTIKTSYAYMLRKNKKRNE